MLGPLDYLIWLIAFLLEVSVIFCISYRKVFHRYFSISSYMLCAAAVNCGQYISILKFGISSKEYWYFYYYTGSLLTILMFFVIIQLYQHVFAELHVHRYIRGAASILLFATALFSYFVVRHNTDRLTNEFVVELGQNLYFVGVVLTYLLWAAILQLRETRTRLTQLVLALGIYFSGNAGTYALRNLFPGLQPAFLQWVPPLFGTLLPLAWAYTFFKVPEEARLATARLTTARLAVTTR